MMSAPLEDHLNQMFALSLRASALAVALSAIVDDPDLNDTALQIALALSDVTSKLSIGLDSPLGRLMEGGA